MKLVTGRKLIILPDFSETSLEKYFKNSVSTLNKGFLIHVGIDGFKMINENYGWDYGDYILRETASCILSCISDSQRSTR